MFVDLVLAWLLVFSLQSVMGTDSTAVNEMSVSAHSSTQTANQMSNSPGDLAKTNSIEPSNSISNQVSPTLTFEPLTSATVSQQSAGMSLGSDENSLSNYIESSVHQTSVTTLVEQTTLTTAMLESTQNVVSPSETSVQSMLTSSELSHLLTPSPIADESSTHLAESPTTSIEPAATSDSGIMSHRFNSASASWSQPYESLATNASSDIPSTELMSPTIQPRSDYTSMLTTPMQITSTTNSHSAFDYSNSTETTISSALIMETNSAFAPTSILSQISDVDTTVEVSTLAAESLKPLTLSGYGSMTPGSDFAFETITVSVITFPSDSITPNDTASPVTTLNDSITPTDTASPVTTLNDSITPTDTASPVTTLNDSITPTDTASPVTTMQSSVDISTTSDSTASITVTPTTSLSSAITSPTPGGTESSSSAQSVPLKSSSGLSTGGKVAIGIIIPLAVIGLIILGVFFYRRYHWNRGGFKNFLQPGVHYRAYTNETFTDDDVTVGGNWRKMSDS